MAFTRFQFQPGVNTVITPTLGGQNWVSSNRIRFRGGLPEQMGGVSLMSTTAFTTPVTALAAYLGGSQLDTPTVVSGDDEHLTVFTPTGVPPVDNTGVQINPREITIENSTTTLEFIGSSTVNVDFNTNHGIQTGLPIYQNNTAILRNLIFLWCGDASGAAGLGRFLVPGDYEVSSVIDAQIVQIQVPNNTWTSNVGDVTRPAFYFSSTIGESAVLVDIDGTTATTPNVVANQNRYWYGTTNISNIALSGLYNIVGLLKTGSSTSFWMETGVTAAATVANVRQNDGDMLFTLNYGIISPVTSSPANLVTGPWSIADYGNILISNKYNGSMYYYNPTKYKDQSSIIPSSPHKSRGVFVAMPQQMAVAWGSSYLESYGETGYQDPLLIRWSDIGNFLQWSSIDNTGGITSANYFRIPYGGEIVACCQAPQQALVWTQESLWSMQWTEDPVSPWAFTEIGQRCGLAGPRAFAILNGVVYWCGRNGFWTLSGSGVQPLVCDVRDNLFQLAQADPTIFDNIVMGGNSLFNEIFVSYRAETNAADGHINTNYLKYNVLEDTWDFGVMGRDAWVDAGVFPYPIAAGDSGVTADNNGYIYNQEYGYTFPDNTENPPFIESGYMMIGDGSPLTYTGFWVPDFKYGAFGQSADTVIDTYATFRNWSGSASSTQVVGPLSFDDTSEFANERGRGRMIAMKYQRNAATQGFWRMGNFRAGAKPDGGR